MIRARLMRWSFLPARSLLSFNTFVLTFRTVPPRRRQSYLDDRSVPVAAAVKADMAFPAVASVAVIFATGPAVESPEYLSDFAFPAQPVSHKGSVLVAVNASKPPWPSFWRRFVIKAVLFLWSERAFSSSFRPRLVARSCANKYRTKL